MPAVISYLLALAGGFLVGLIAAVSGASLVLAMAVGLGVTVVSAGILWIVDRRRAERRQGDRRGTAASGPVVYVSDQGVASVSQQGGQTAHQIVNVGPQPRTFAGIDISELRTYLAGFAGTEIAVSCALGNGEAAFFAEELKRLFEGAGWKVNGVSHAVLMPPARHVQLRLTGGDATAHPWAQGFGNRLIRLGFPCEGSMSAPHDEIHVGQA